jgi:Arc/MetJ-type ribon-helix-helix transcriptional regulator
MGRKNRIQTAVDLPPDQVAWLDAQAKAALCSRSAFVRQLIQRLMAEQGAAQ